MQLDERVELWDAWVHIEAPHWRLTLFHVKPRQAGSEAALKVSRETWV